MLLKWMLSKMELVWIGFIWLRIGSNGGNEPWCSTDKELLNQLNN
jgi:hypothetical protein